MATWQAILPRICSGNRHSRHWRRGVAHQRLQFDDEGRWRWEVCGGFHGPGSSSTVFPLGSCSYQSPVIIVLLCRESNDFLLPAVITFLNSRDWQLRAAFFRHISAMGASSNTEGLESFLLPCLEQVRQRAPAQHRCCIWLQAYIRCICRSQVTAGHRPSSCVDTVCVPPILRVWRSSCCPAWSMWPPAGVRETTRNVGQRQVGATMSSAKG